MTPKRRFSTRFQNKDEEDLSDISDISCPDPPELQPSKSNKTKKKRHKFTHSEDKEILNYIMTENRYNEIKGLALYKDMEILKITNHTKQSMKCRFLKTIVPNLHQYNISKAWVTRLNRMFPELTGKRLDKENAKSNSPHGSILARWRRQSPSLRSPSRLPANNSTKTSEEEKDVSEQDETGSNKETRKCSVSVKQKGESCRLRSSPRFPATVSTKTAEESDRSEEDEAGDNNEPCNSSSSEKQKYQSTSLRSSPPLSATDSKKTGTESDVSENEEPNVDNEGCNTEATIPYTESPYFPRRRKRQKYQSLRFNSSSESEAEEEQVERNGSDPSAAADCSDSPDTSPSEPAKNVSKDNSSEQSELSDYDQYLMEIAEKASAGGKNSSRSDENGSQSNKADTTNDECVPETDDEMDQESSISIVDDRRSRLQRRRHIKKVQKAFGTHSNTSTSPQKKGKKTNLAEFVTNSNPEETLNENKDESSPEKSCGELSEYKTIISDIAQSYGLTNREVLSTIFSFNGSIDKTISYIKLGPEMSGLKPWGEEEDQIISSTDESSIKTVGKKRGNKFIAERLQFLENFPEEIIS